MEFQGIWQEGQEGSVAMQVGTAIAMNQPAGISPRFLKTSVAAENRDERRATNCFYLRARGCFIETQAPFCELLATHCSMKSMPSTPSLTFG